MIDENGTPRRLPRHRRRLNIKPTKNTMLEGFLPESEDVVLGLAGGGGQQVGDGLEDGADGFGRDAFFLGLDAECGDQRCQLLDVNHNQNSFAILRRKATLIGRCGKRQGF